MGAGVELGEERHSKLRNRCLPSVAESLPQPLGMLTAPRPKCTSLAIRATKITLDTGLLGIPRAESSQGDSRALCKLPAPLDTLLPVSAPRRGRRVPWEARVQPQEDERSREGGPELQVTCAGPRAGTGSAPFPFPAQRRAATACGLGLGPGRRPQQPGRGGRSAGLGLGAGDTDAPHLLCSYVRAAVLWTGEGRRPR